MADREKERAARNRDLIARMSVPPTKAQILDELDLEISDAIHLATMADFRTLLRVLRMARLELGQLRQPPEFKKGS
jgi:hypothetical protein